MKSIGEFFSKIRNSQAKELFGRSVAQGSLKKRLGIEISADDVSFSGRALVLSGLSQEAKSAVYIKKQGILDDMAAGLPGRPVSEITLR